MIHGYFVRVNGKAKHTLGPEDKAEAERLYKAECEADPKAAVVLQAAVSEGLTAQKQNLRTRAPARV